MLRLPAGKLQKLSLGWKRACVDQTDWDELLVQYREAGHVVVQSTLAHVPVRVIIPPYAQTRMKQRDIDESEVLEALALPASSHGRGKTDGRYEVAGKTSRGTLRVIYDRPDPAIVLIITTHLESD